MYMKYLRLHLTILYIDDALAPIDIIHIKSDNLRLIPKLDYISFIGISSLRAIIVHAKFINQVVQPRFLPLNQPLIYGVFKTCSIVCSQFNFPLYIGGAI